MREPAKYPFTLEFAFQRTASGITPIVTFFAESGEFTFDLGMQTFDQAMRDFTRLYLSHLMSAEALD